MAVMVVSITFFMFVLAVLIAVLIAFQVPTVRAFIMSQHAWTTGFTTFIAVSTVTFIKFQTETRNAFIPFQTVVVMVLITFHFSAMFPLINLKLARVVHL